MTISRRDLIKLGVKAGVGATLLGGLPSQLWATSAASEPSMPIPITDPWIKELALRAVDSARSAGAQYADVRLTYTREKGGSHGTVEALVVGVRSLVDGYWGFAGGRLWTPDEMARLGRESVAQARALSIGPVRKFDLAAAPIPVDEHWTMPIEIDPFEEVSDEEISDFLRGLGYFIEVHPNFEKDLLIARFLVQDKAFASSEGAYCTQRLYRSAGAVVAVLRKNGQTLRRGVDTLTPAGLGWELFKGQPLREQIRRLMDEMEEDIMMPVKPVEVGRYNVVCDALTITNLASLTLGTATQLDRVFGYEANASGTSYLNDPLGMLGSFEIGAPLLTLTADRSEHGGAATVAWDDDGVRPDEFTLVREGVLHDFQTTRESAAWLSDAYTKASREIRSHGCAAAPTAVEAPLTHTPNLRIHPGGEALDFVDLVSGIEEGLAIKGMHVDMDFQGLNGLGQGRVYEVKNGKRVARIEGAGFLFRAPELWKSLVALGGEESVRRYGTTSKKGEPEQTMYHSVSAPPAVFKEFTVIDPKRKA